MGLDISIWRTGKLYWLEAVKDVHVLDLSWILPSLRKDYMKKAEDYLAHLLGHGKMVFCCLPYYGWFFLFKSKIWWLFMTFVLYIPVWVPWILDMNKMFVLVHSKNEAAWYYFDDASCSFRQQLLYFMYSFFFGCSMPVKFPLTNQSQTLLFLDLEIS